MKLKSFYSFSIYICFLLVMTGCGRTLMLVPMPQDVNPAKTPEANYKSTLTLKNVHKSTEPVFVGKFTVHTFQGNMNEWTEKLREQLQKELEARGATISPDSTKTLSLSLDSPAFELTNGGFIFKCDLKLRASTGSGYEQTYDITNRTGSGAAQSCGGAITLAIIELLNDQNIVNYLSDN